MQKFSLSKKIQLFLLVLLSGFCAFLAFSDRLFYEKMAEHTGALGVYVMMWVVLLVGFFFMLVDFMFLNKIKRDYHNMNRVAYYDNLSGIPNRFSCDMMLEKYEGVRLPLDIGCVMFEIANLAAVNREQGHAQGNELIKDFAAALMAASVGSCLVWRNGGNKFLAVFEDSTAEEIQRFITRVEEKVCAHNAGSPERKMAYRVGLAFNGEEKLEQMTELISRANAKIHLKE